ncbi:8206_t:CDS:2, partial [Gigaspora margarita]
KDLANIIQYFRKGDTTDPKKDPENDASNLLKVLRTFKEEDSTWFIADHLLAQALMSNEMTSLYTWVLNNILTAIENLPLSTIFSNCDTELEPAIEVIFLATQYIHCIFHIIQNIKKQLAYFLGSQYIEFLADSLASSSWVFPKLVEYLKSVLTNEIFQIQKAQIDVCFEYNAQPIPFEQVFLYDNADAIDDAACIENYSDKRQIALKSLIKRVDDGNIIELWKVQHMNVNTVSTNCIVLLKDQLHGADLHKVNTLFNSCGILDSFEELPMKDEVQASFSTMDMIRNLRKDNLNNNCKEIEHKISKQQVYSECAALGQKLVALAFEFNLTYIATTLRGLIQQMEQANG